MRKKLFFLIFLFMLLIPLASCGSTNSSRADNGNSVYVSSDSINTNGRKVIYTVSYDYSGNKVKETASDVTNYVISLNGYISSSQTYDSRSNYVYKIPTENINTFINYIDSKDIFSNKSISSKDVTSSYDSYGARIERLEEQKKIYEDELKTNNSLTIEQKLSYNDRISEIDKELATIHSEYDVLKEDVDYSTIYFYFNQKDDFDWLHNFLNILLQILIFIGLTLVISAPFLIIGLIIFLILRKKKKVNIEE